MNDKKQWYQDVDVLTKVMAAAFLVLLVVGIQLFAPDFFAIHCNLLLAVTFMAWLSICVPLVRGQ